MVSVYRFPGKSRAPWPACVPLHLGISLPACVGALLWAFLAGAFSGGPAGKDIGAPQQQNPSGIGFSWNGTLVFAEAQYAYPSLGTTVSVNQAEPIVRTYKLGIRSDDKQFADQAIDNSGLSLANPAGIANPDIPMRRVKDEAVVGLHTMILF